MTYNLKVYSFAVTGNTTFVTGAANGCYVEMGSADGPGVVNRIMILPTGVIHDMDGTADAARIPPVLWQDLVFQAANPNGHTQYKNLVNLVGKRGTLTVEVPGAAAQAQTTVQARLRPLRGSWEAPYRIGTFNTLTIRAEWQLFGLL